MKKRATKFPGWLLILIPVVLIALVTAWLWPKGETEDLTGPGIAYLEARENKDPDDVTQVLRQRRQAELEAQREELLRRVRADELDPFTLFRDSVIMGDSRAEGFWYFGYVDEAWTLTGAGHTILNISKQMDALVSMNPQYIYLCYGLNELKMGLWTSSDAFVARYMEIIAEIHTRLPDATVVVSSILPAQEWVYEEKETQPGATAPTESAEQRELRRLANIPVWNEALAKACEENDVIFVDNTAICEEYAHLWETDGIHVKRSFYPHWAKNLVVAALEEGSVRVEENDS